MAYCKTARFVQFCAIGARTEVATMEPIPLIKRFADGDRIYVRAQQVWLVLVSIVMTSERQPKKPTTITYGELAVRMGYPDKRAGHTLARQLGIVGEYCKFNDLPALNAIVVNELTRAPGTDVVLRDGSTVAREQADIMRQDWYALRIPTTGTFRKVWESMN